MLAVLLQICHLIELQQHRHPYFYHKFEEKLKGKNRYSPVVYVYVNRTSARTYLIIIGSNRCFSKVGYRKPPPNFDGTKGRRPGGAFLVSPRLVLLVDFWIRRRIFVRWHFWNESLDSAMFSDEFTFFVVNSLAAVELQDILPAKDRKNREALNQKIKNKSYHQTVIRLRTFPIQHLRKLCTKEYKNIIQLHA